MLRLGGCVRFGSVAVAVPHTVGRRAISHAATIAKLRALPLFHEKAYINGEWCEASPGGEPIAVVDPASHEVVGVVPDAGEAGAVRAVEAAGEAWGAWKAATAKERGTVLRRWNDLLLEHKQPLAELMAVEMGKPVAEAAGEVVYAASFLEWFAEEGRRAYGDVIPSHARGKKVIVQKEPVGVVGCVTPWNFPLAMLTRKAGAALAAGCPIVAKPSELTPFSALALAALAEDAGLPKGLFSVVPGRPNPIGKVLTQHPIVRKFTFTGSTGVGTMLAQQAAAGARRVSLELGGNAPFIVFESADLDEAVAGAMASKFRNTGQTCVCTNRILVQASVYDQFVAKMRTKVEQLKVDSPLLATTTQGPLVNKAALAKVQAHVQDAVAKGGDVVVGGVAHSLGGTFFQPTLLQGVDHTTMKVGCEETFGPVAAVGKFESEADAVAMANATTAGLAAYFYSRDVGQCWRVCDALEYGMVGVNDGIMSTEVAPFGGVKMSGVGREGSKYGLDDYMELKYCLFKL